MYKEFAFYRYRTMLIFMVCFGLVFAGMAFFFLTVFSAVASMESDGGTAQQNILLLLIPWLFICIGLSVSVYGFIWLVSNKPILSGNMFELRLQKNFFKSYHVPWEDIANLTYTVHYRTFHGIRSYRYLTVNLKTGSSLRISLNSVKETQHTIAEAIKQTAPEIIWIVDNPLDNVFDF
ncbi:hypothetical protein [Streptococcus dentiloxodontae]